MYEERNISQEEVKQIFNTISENYFYDYKDKRIKPGKLTISVSAFANASGGEIYLGITENNKTKEKVWDGFLNIEDANAHIQSIINLKTVENFVQFSFLKHSILNTYVLHISISKTKPIIYATDGIAYIRHNAQNLPVNTDEKIRRLELDKGIVSFEDETISETSFDDISNSEILTNFIHNIVPKLDNISWIKRQHLFNGSHLTVAGTLLFTDEPQIFLPKRSSIKVFRYKTSEKGDRDTLYKDPETIEGCAYNQIYDAVKKVKSIIESINILNSKFMYINYPDETLHEIITNAVLHRDYSISTDIQVRIFDNRIEVESPGKLPGHVTVDNILEEQSARNPKIVRLINKFPDAPNKDVGEGLNTAFDAMNKLRLKPPIIKEKDNSVLVIIRHEKLASPERIIVEYLQSHDMIKNRIGRELTGIKSENTMKNVFYRLKKSGFITLVKPGKYWKKTENFDQLVASQLDDFK